MELESKIEELREIIRQKDKKLNSLREREVRMTRLGQKHQSEIDKMEKAHTKATEHFEHQYEKELEKLENKQEQEAEDMERRHEKEMNKIEGKYDLFDDGEDSEVVDLK